MPYPNRRSTRVTDLTEAEIRSWRAEFPILEKTAYLNSCSLGALSRRSMGYLAEYQELWNTMGASAWYELWLGRIETLRGVVAELLNGEVAEVGLVPSVSAGLSSIASALDYGRRNRVVMAELDFPTLGHQWLARPGVEVVRVPSEDGIGVSAEAWADHVDERTAVVATSHVFYSTGYIQDLPAIGRIARTAGALFLVDGYHGMGQLPVDPRALGADVYLAGPLKWMLGGPGLAYLWARREIVPTLSPTIASWFADAEQFDFRVDRLTLRDDAGRFAMGTPAIPTVYTAMGGAEIVSEVGPERIHGRIRVLVDDLIARAGAAGMHPRVAADPQRRSGIVMIPSRDAAAAVRSLADAGVIVDRRGSAVRVSPHFYNTPEDNARAVAALARAEMG
jgi:kynureninase